MRCPQCGTENLATSVYCAQCGSPLGTGVAPEPVLPGWPVPIAPSTPRGQAGAPGPLPPFGMLASVPVARQYPVMCGVCGSAIYAGQRRCTRCHAPYGAIMDPNDPTATSFIPFGPPVPLVPIFRAGDPRAGGNTDDTVWGWNWPAAIAPTLWAARHKMVRQAIISGLLTLFLACLYLVRAAAHPQPPDNGGLLTGLLVTCALIFAVPRSIVAGRRGSEMAWRSGLYPDRDAVRRAQRSWTPWAIIGVVGAASLLGVAAAILNAR